MRIILVLCRLLLGVLLVVSGLIKANDPLGFSYKLEEYFTVFKTTDSLPDTTFAQRRLKLHEVQTLIAEAQKTQLPDLQGKYTVVKVSGEAVPMDSLAGAPEDTLVEVRERSITYTGHVPDNTFNRLCDVLHGRALILAACISIVETLLGLLILFGYYMRVVGLLNLAMMVFFTFLTYYSARYNKVTDCGCFGDALHLEPWQSFWKDVVLLFISLPLAIFPRRANGSTFDTSEKVVALLGPVLGLVVSIEVFDWWLPGLFISIMAGLRVVVHYSLFEDSLVKGFITVLAFVAVAFFTWYCYNHLPVKDYRPWAPGKGLPSQTIPTPEVADIYMIYRNKETGEEKEFLAVKNEPDGRKINDFSWMTEDFLAHHEFVNQRKKVIRPFKEAPIHDFDLEDPETGEAYGKAFIQKPGCRFLLVAYDLKKTHTERMEEINVLAKKAAENQVEFIAATASRDEAEAFRHAHQNPFKFYFNDATALKTIIRSNPGLVLLKDTTVVKMWHHKDFPTFEKAMKYCR